MILVNAFVSLAVICSAVIGSPVYSSSVYVKSGPDVLPLEYVEYAPSFSIPRAQLAQLTAAPVGSVVGYPSSVTYQGLAPCVSPCVYETVPQLPAQNAKIVTYQAPLPKVSVGYVPKDEPRGYEYSYLVYDEGTGDQKAQHETSDGGVVRGQYSLLQPDGYVREVQYSAGDDGFNAVVKNFRPKPEADKAELKEEKKEEAPCDKEKENVEASSETSESPKKESQEIVETSSSPSESNEVAEPSSAKPPPVENKIYLTFQDLVRCAQLAGKAAAEEKPSAESPEANVEMIDNVPEKSALTYIVIPSLNAPC